MEKAVRSRLRTVSGSQNQNMFDMFKTFALRLPFYMLLCAENEEDPGEAKGQAAAWPWC